MTFFLLILALKIKNYKKINTTYLLQNFLRKQWAGLLNKKRVAKKSLFSHPLVNLFFITKILTEKWFKMNTS